MKRRFQFLPSIIEATGGRRKMSSRTRSVLIVLSLLVATSASVVALATPASKWRQIKSLLANVGVGNPCVYTSDCNGLVVGNNNIPATPDCFEKKCCSESSCSQLSDCCTNWANANDLACVQEWGPAFPTTCCEKLNTPCQADNEGACCNAYYWAAENGVGLVAGGTATACANGSCTTCGTNGAPAGSAYPPKITPYGNGLGTKDNITKSLCCTGYAANIGEANDQAFCCSEIGQNCGSNVGAPNAYCCGSRYDRTLGTTAAFTECSALTNRCCIESGPNQPRHCTQNSDCCTNFCDLSGGPGTGTCSDGACNQ
jgi:hypothetical protein